MNYMRQDYPHLTINAGMSHAKYRNVLYIKVSPDDWVTITKILYDCATQTQGPALQTTPKRLTPFTHYDAVRCTRCLVWLPQAADCGDWHMRSRNHGVSDKATVNEVVSNGCDLVVAVHPSCHSHEQKSHC